MATLPFFWQKNYQADGPESVLLDVETDSSAILRIAYTFLPDIVSIPGNATFGGWWPISGPTPSLADFAHAQECLESRFLSPFTLQVTLPPTYFYPEFFDPQRELFRILGYHLVEDTNQTVPLARAEELRVSRGNSKRIRQFAKVGSVSPASPDDMAECFELLALSRQKRGVALSLEKDEFLSNLQDQPEQYHCWKAEIGDRLVGAAYTVEIAEDVTYVLYWGDSPEGRAYSVTASLFIEIRKHALQLGKSFLDLGKSSTGGVLDEGLARFKRNLSAKSFKQQVWTSPDRRTLDL